MHKPLILIASVLALPAFAQGAPEASITPPAAIVADGIPKVPERLRAATQPYLEFRTALVQGWNPKTKSLLFVTRFGNSNQLHEVAGPGMARTQISFETEPVAEAEYSPAGDVLLASKDVGGGEFFQLYRLDQGALTLLTDGKSRNTGAVWSKRGTLVGYSSTRRNGTDTDLWIVDPRDPAATDKMVAQLAGGGWSFLDFAPNDGKALVGHYLSIQSSEIWEIDFASGKMTKLTADTTPVAYADARYGPDGTIYAASDRGGEFQRLGVLARDGSFRAINPDPKWDVDAFEIADDGSFIAYTLNEAGRSSLKLIDPKTGKLIGTAALPPGVISALEIAPWNAVAFTMANAQTPADAFVLDPQTMAVTRWTYSETGGLDASKNRLPELVTAKSFDGVEVSGFLTRPDPAKFPGPRPLIVDIHGGPESQSRPGFLGRNNYLINQLGIAVFYPNVRGSSGYGKTFVGLDNGPDRRENSVKDIGAFLAKFAKDPGIDAKRVAVTGGSYGGYMCYATAIAYGPQLRSALCTVAISNFVTFLENTQSYRRDLRRVEYGDERDPAQRAKLTQISPLTSIGKLDIPLMVVTGANDPRVPKSEADQVVAAVRKNGKTVWHLVANDEGHGYRKKANTDFNFWTTVLFWEGTLLK